MSSVDVPFGGPSCTEDTTYLKFFYLVYEISVVGDRRSDRDREHEVQCDQKKSPNFYKSYQKMVSLEK